MTAEEREEWEIENARRKRRREEEEERAAEAKKQQQTFAFRSTEEDLKRLQEKHRDEMVCVTWRHTYLFIQTMRLNTLKLFSKYPRNQSQLIPCCTHIYFLTLKLK